MGLYSYLILVIAEVGQVYRTVARHFVRPHRQAVEMGLEMMGTPFAECSEIVIANSHPADPDLWRPTKALRAGDLVVADRGQSGAGDTPPREGRAAWEVARTRRRPWCGCVSASNNGGVGRAGVT